MNIAFVAPADYVTHEPVREEASFTGLPPGRVVSMQYPSRSREGVMYNTRLERLKQNFDEFHLAYRCSCPSWPGPCSHEMAMRNDINQALLAMLREGDIDMKKLQTQLAEGGAARAP